MARNKWQQQRNKRGQKKNVALPNKSQNSCFTISDEEALRIHGLFFANGGCSTDSDSGRSFDEEYYKNKPTPLQITPLNTVTIKRIASNNEQPQVVNGHVYNTERTKDTFSTSGQSYYEQNFPPLHQNLNKSRTNQLISQNFKENMQNAKTRKNRRKRRKNVTNLPTPMHTQGTTYTDTSNVPTKVPNSTLANATGTRTVLQNSTGIKSGGCIGSNQRNVYNIPEISRPAENVTNLRGHSNTQNAAPIFDLPKAIRKVANSTPKSNKVNYVAPLEVSQTSFGNDYLNVSARRHLHDEVQRNISEQTADMDGLSEAENANNLGAHRNSLKVAPISDLPKVITKINSTPKSNTVSSVAQRKVLPTSSRNDYLNVSSQRHLHDEAQRNISEQTADTDKPSEVENKTNLLVHKNTQNSVCMADLPKVITKLPNSTPQSNTENSVAPPVPLRTSRSNNLSFSAQRDLNDEAERNISQQTLHTSELCEDDIIFTEFIPLTSKSFCGRCIDFLLCRKC